jgi:hypothetical protein
VYAPRMGGEMGVRAGGGDGGEVCGRGLAVTVNERSWEEGGPVF